MEEPRSELVKLGEREFHYLDWGDRDAPPILFLHGFAGHAWQTIFPAQVLGEDHWVMLDQRGHGDSAWADVYGSVPMVADGGVPSGWASAVPRRRSLDGRHQRCACRVCIGPRRCAGAGYRARINRWTGPHQSNVRQGDTFGSVDDALPASR
jgi:hypothetical protein